MELESADEYLMLLLDFFKRLDPRVKHAMKQPFLQCLEQDLGRGLIKSILLAQLNPDDMSSCEKAEIIEELAGYLLASRATKTSDRFTICCLES